MSSAQEATDTPTEFNDNNNNNNTSQQGQVQLQQQKQHQQETTTTPTPPPAATSSTGFSESVPQTPTRSNNSNNNSNGNNNIRRSKRIAEPVIAPGYGTHKDLLRLTRELTVGRNNNNNDNNNNITSSGGVSSVPCLTYEAVEAIMKSRGRGVRSSSRHNPDAQQQAAAAASPPAAGASAWADFMADSGVSMSGGSGNSSNAAAVAATSTGRKRKAAGRRNDEDNDDDDKGNNSGSGNADEVRQYTLPAEWQELEEQATAAAASTKQKTKKRVKVTTVTKSNNNAPSGILLQAGTLDASIVGRTKLTKAQSAQVYHCSVPSRILPSSIRISHVFTSCNAVHSFALATNGTTYAWGRNESQQLGLSSSSSSSGDGASLSPKNVFTPTELDLPAPLRMAAVGKSHSVFLLQDNSLHAVGANKTGQCSVRNFQEVIPNIRKCVVPESSNGDGGDDKNAEPIVWAQIACGEDFTLAVSTMGHLYSCGCSQYGQLGNGETGEHIVTANKIAFANANTLQRRMVYCHAPTEKLHVNNEEAKVVPIPGQGSHEILIQQVACGKHHSLALEAMSTSSTTTTNHHRPRVFSFGCGDYGCLGHGIQKDEYYPRVIGMLQKLPLGNDSAAGGFTITAGAHCSLLLSKAASGHVYYWGKHRSIGEATMRPTLVDVLANNQHVVTSAVAGGQTVICSTSLAQTVAWGQGPHGELGLGTPKSSSKPTFVEALNSIQVLQVAAGYGHTLFVVDDDSSSSTAGEQDDDNDKTKKGEDEPTKTNNPKIEELPQVEEEDLEPLLEQQQQQQSSNHYHNA